MHPDTNPALDHLAAELDEAHWQIVYLINELANITRRSQWRPFGTAPEDGTEILAYRQDSGVIVVHFVSPSDYNSDGDDEPEWFTITGEHLCGDELPTHWMPMPSPPE